MAVAGPSWEALVAAAPQGFVAIDAEGAIRAWNDAATRLLGPAPAAGVAAPWIDALAPILHDGTTPCTAEAFPLLRALGGEPVPLFELRLGETWIVGAAAPIAAEPGRSGGAVMTFADGTAARRVREALAGERGALRRLSRRLGAVAAPEPALADDAELVAALERILDAARDLVPAEVARLDRSDGPDAPLRSGAIGPDLAADLDEAAAWVRREGRALLLAERGARALAGVPLRLGHETVGALLVATAAPRSWDEETIEFLEALAARAAALVARRGHLAELERHRAHLEELVRERTAALEETHRRLRLADRLASMGTLTAGLAHDMSHLLFPIRCRLDGIDPEAAPEPFRGALRVVADATDHLQDLCDGLRLVGLDPEDDRAAPAATDPAAWIARVGPLLDRSMPAGVRLERSVAPDAPAIGIAPHRLARVAMNLVVNGGDASPPGATVMLRIARGAAGEALLEVRDAGAGMSEAVRERAFDPYFSTKTRGASTGLGLAVVQGIVAAANGSIELETAPGRGTRVLLRLPAARNGGAVRPAPAGGAAVTLGDARAAAWLRGLLAEAGWTREEDPALARLWVLDDAPARAARIATFLAGSPRRRIVCIGAAPGFESRPGMCVVPEPGDLAAIRAALDAAGDDDEGDAT